MTPLSTLRLTCDPTDRVSQASYWHVAKLKGHGGYNREHNIRFDGCSYAPSLPAGVEALTLVGRSSVLARVQKDN